MRVLFCGTPEFAAAVLEPLLSSRHETVGVVSQPSRPRGRGQKVEDPPAVRTARAAGLPVLQPEKLHSEATLGEIHRLAPDLLVTAAFGRILRPSLLDLPPRGCWNVHASLLPRHRGASPVAASLLAGDSWTGVTLFRLDPGLDTGPLLLQEMTAVGPDETAGDLTGRLAALGGALLLRALDLAEAGDLREQPQPPVGATYAPILSKDDGRIRWDRPAEQVDRLVRALTPWPGAFTFLDRKRLRVERVRPVHRMETPGTEPGTLVPLASGGIGVACLPGLVELLEVQAEGRKRQPAPEWLRGVRLSPSTRLDAA